MSNRITDLRVVALAGGVGGAKLVVGLDQLLPPGQLTAIVNTGDDFEHFGLKICPDLILFVIHWPAWRILNMAGAWPMRPGRSAGRLKTLKHPPGFSWGIEIWPPTSSGRACCRLA